MYRPLILFLLLSAVSPLSAQPLTLDAALAFALEHNHAIRLARLDVDLARETRGLGTAGYLPTLDFGASASYTGSRQDSNSPFTFGDSDTRALSAQLSLNWTLFDGFRMFADDARYRELTSLGETQARARIEATVLDVARAWFTLAQQQQLDSVYALTLSISRTRLEEARVRRSFGGSLTEALNAEVAYTNDSLEAIEQRHVLDIARHSLNLALGRSSDLPIEVLHDVELPALPYSDAALFELARERNATLRASRHALGVAREERALRRGNFFPRVSAFAQYGMSDRTVIPAVPRAGGNILTSGTDAVAGLNLSMNLFNGFRNSIDVQRATIEERQAEIALEEEHLRLDAALHEQLSQLRLREAALKLTGQNREAARAALELQVERFEAGSASSLEFRDAQLQFVRAATAHIDARLRLRLAQLALLRSIGDIVR